MKTMKSKAFVIGVIVAMSMVGCQKEELNMQVPGAGFVTGTGYVSYSVDGVSACEALDGEHDLHSFVARMVRLASEGHSVYVVSGVQSTPFAGKESVTFVTYSEKEAIAWTEKMIEKGYDVSIRFNDTTKQFECLAIKVDKQS